MNKRIISIFLIVSIIASSFAISAVSTSAYSTPTGPISKSVLPYSDGKYINVNWQHDGLLTKKYCISYAELGKENWKSIYTNSSAQKYINIAGLNRDKTYKIRVSALGLNKQYSRYSALHTVQLRTEITWCRTKNIKKITKNKITYKIDQAEIGLANITSAKIDHFNIALFKNGKLISNKYKTNNHYFYSGLYYSTEKIVYQAQAVYVVGGHEFTSAWSHPKTVNTPHK